MPIGEDLVTRLGGIRLKMLVGLLGERLAEGRVGAAQVLDALAFDEEADRRVLALDDDIEGWPPSAGPRRPLLLKAHVAGDGAAAGQRNVSTERCERVDCQR